VLAKIRYNDSGTPATITQTTANTIEVHFHEPVNAIAPGQAAVFYEGDDVVAGGWIMKSYTTLN
jgi:tRNA-specific 2-thiouridylase